MSVRLFAGYFLVLAACAVVAFGSTEPEPYVQPFSAEAGMMPMGFPAYRADFPTASFSVRPHKLVSKRTRLANAQ